MGIVGIVVSFFACLGGLAYCFLRYKQKHWSKFGIPAAARPHLLFGNVARLGRTEHSNGVLQRLYWEFKRQAWTFGGFMNFFQPAILVVDPELVKHILVKDFNFFHDRGVYVDTVGDPLSGGLFSLEGAEWKAMRQKLTPTFTSGKMKYMFGLVLTVAQEMKGFVEENCRRSDMEMKNVLQRFTMDVIGNVAFGIDCNTLRNPDSQFSQMGNKAFVFDTKKLLKFFVGGQYKTLARKLGMKVVFEDVTQFFMGLTKSTVQLRESSSVKRNDFINLLLEIKNKGKFSTEPNSGGEGITMEQIAAQCFVFFTAGFETSSTTMNFCLYELALNPDIQTKLRKEIQTAIAKDNGNLSYETLLEMNLLDRVVNETLRKYPPLDNLVRISSTAYTIPNTKHTVPAQTMVQVPIYAMQHDSEHFPDPERFDPDRFLPEVVKSRHPYAYLPFGEGPRNCIGLRFGLMLTKIGLVTLLSNFRFSANSRTPKKLTFDPVLLVLSPTQGMYFSIEPLRA